MRAFASSPVVQIVTALVLAGAGAIGLLSGQSGQIVGWGLMVLAIVIAIWALGEEARKRGWWPFRKKTAPPAAPPAPGTAWRPPPSVLAIHPTAKVGRAQIKGVRGFSTIIHNEGTLDEASVEDVGLETSPPTEPPTQDDVPTG